MKLFEYPKNRNVQKQYIPSSSLRTPKNLNNGDTRYGI